MSTLILPDAKAAICGYLRAQPIIADMVDLTPSGLDGIPAGVPAVFRPDLPKSIDQSMPLACIVARPAPGGYKTFGGQRFYMADSVIDFICFADSSNRAARIADTLCVVLKQLCANASGEVRPQVWEHTMLYSASVKAGPVPLPDEQTLWPAVWLSATVTHGELPA